LTAAKDNTVIENERFIAFLGLIKLKFPHVPPPKNPAIKAKKSCLFKEKSMTMRCDAMHNKRKKLDKF
jgi:hypothetical protein